MNVTYQRANVSDAPTLSNIALKAKAHWQYPNAWLDFWKDDLAVSTSFIEQHHVMSAYHDNERIGFYSLIFSIDSPCVYMAHLWVLPKFIGNGFGKVLFKQAVLDCRLHHKTTMQLESDPNAQGFYEHMGMIKYGEVHSKVLDIERTLPKMRLTFNATSIKE